MQNRQDFPKGLPMEELMKLANSPQGQALLSQLQGQYSKELETAVAHAQSGDLEKVKESVSSFLNSPAGKELARQLRGKNNG
jgi:hypothetical protein